VTDTPGTPNQGGRPDPQLFVRLLMQHDRTIRAFLRGLLPTSADVDEVMQEVSVVAWRKFDQLDRPENFLRWACGIARYEVLTYRRGKARDRLVLGEDIETLMADEGLEELPQRKQQLAALEDCLNKLPVERRQLVLQAYSARGQLKSLAEKVGKSPEALYKLISRIRRQLLACVERFLAAEV